MYKKKCIGIKLTQRKKYSYHASLKPLLGFCLFGWFFGQEKKVEDSLNATSNGKNTNSIRTFSIILA